MTLLKCRTKLTRLESVKTEGWKEEENMVKWLVQRRWKDSAVAAQGRKMTAQLVEDYRKEEFAMCKQGRREACCCKQWM